MKPNALPAQHHPYFKSSFMGLCLPSVVLCIEEEVCAHNGHTHSNDAQNHQNQHHEAIHIVDFVCPKWCENEVPKKHRKCYVSFLLTDA